MLAEFREVWSILGSIISALPANIVSVVSFVCCGIGIIGFLRSL